MSEAEYSLKRSFEVLKLPFEARAPIIEDEKGNIIDGLHRVKDGVECPRVQIPIKNRGQPHLIRLLINGCRRKLTKEEKEQAVVAIAENYGLTTAKEIAAVLPYGEDWVRSYLPSRFKDTTKARAATIRHEFAGHHPAKTVMEVAKIGETEEEFCTRISQTINAHATQLIKKDLQIVVNHMHDKGNCEACPMKDGCLSILEIILLQNQLTNCMSSRLARLMK